jgi:hypothetical protein
MLTSLVQSDGAPGSVIDSLVFASTPLVSTAYFLTFGSSTRPKTDEAAAIAWRKAGLAALNVVPVDGEIAGCHCCALSPSAVRVESPVPTDKSSRCALGWGAHVPGVIASSTGDAGQHHTCAIRITDVFWKRELVGSFVTKFSAPVGRRLALQRLRRSTGRLLAAYGYAGSGYTSAKRCVVSSSGWAKKGKNARFVVLGLVRAEQPFVVTRSAHGRSHRAVTSGGHIGLSHGTNTALA